MGQAWTQAPQETHSLSRKLSSSLGDTLDSKPLPAMVSAKVPWTSEQARFAMEFCVEESCGKCTPCRIGAVRGVEVIDDLLASDAPGDAEVLLRDLCDVMTQGSLCAMGGMTPQPVLSALDQFPEDFDGGRRRGTPAGQGAVHEQAH